MRKLFTDYSSLWIIYAAFSPKIYLYMTTYQSVNLGLISMESVSLEDLDGSNFPL